MSLIDQTHDQIEADLLLVLDAVLSELHRTRSFADTLGAVQRGDDAGLYTREVVRAALAPFIGAMAQNFVVAGNAAAQAQRWPRSGPHLSKAATPTFDPTAEESASYIEEAALALLLALVLDLSDTTFAAMRLGRTRGWSASKIAHAIRQAAGLTPKAAAAVEAYRGTLERNEIGALRRRLRDDGADDTIRRAVTAGRPLPQRQIDRLVSRYARRLKRHRAQMIARTTATRLINTSQKALIDGQIRLGLIDEGGVKRHWVTRRDERVRHTHRRIPGMNAEGRGAREPFQTPLGPMRFPGDPTGVADNVLGCRCRIKYDLGG